MKRPFNPKVSIVIPVYNGSNYLKEAIDSALAQTYKNIEVIVINDGSNDKGKTDKICKSYGNEIRYFKKENGGVASALNMGIEKMEGEYFSWLSHDDVYLPEKVELQVEALSSVKEKQSVVFSDFCEIDAKGKVIREILLNSRVEKFPRVFLSVETNQYLQGCSLLIHKKLFEIYGEFSETKKCTQDYYMWFKLASNVPFIHIGRILVKSRIHQAQDSILKAELKKNESDIMRYEFVTELTQKEIYGYAKGDFSYFWPLYYLYKNAGYRKFPFALINKMHEVFKKSINVSVIVPVYNVEKYISKCLESLIEQDFMDFEVIIVNDGTKDHSANIAEEYAELCPNFIQVIHKKNGGLGSARNEGLKYVNGKYIGFVDSDDYVHPQMFKKLFAKTNSGFDIVMTEFQAINDVDGSVAWNYKFPKDIDFNKNSEIVMNSTLRIAPSAWNKLFKRTLLDKIPWGDGFYEDLQATPIFLSYAKKIGIIKDNLYFYRVNRRGSIMSTRRDDKRCLSFLKSWENLLKKSNPKYRKEMEYAVYVHLIDIIYAFPAFIDEFIEFFKTKEELFKKNSLIEEDIRNGKIKDLPSIEIIPKVIHYIWFGDNKLSELNNKCIESWKRFAPDYKVIRWDESNCDINENEYVKEAYQHKKWAFVADYFRFKIIEEYGGIYVDTDVEFHKRIDELRLNNIFFAFEKNDIVNGATFGAIPHSSVITKILETYRSNKFINSQNRSGIEYPLPQRITEILVRNYGVKLNGKKQILKNGIKIYPVNELTLDCNDGFSIVEHHYDYSWADKEPSIPYKYYITKEYFKNLLIPENVETDAVILKMENSLSWKITKPLRKFERLIELFKIQGVRITVRNIIVKILKKLYSLVKNQNLQSFK